MIAASTKNSNSVAEKVTQTEWDLSSSITGTVKRRPTSLESCKSNSPVDIKDNNNIDFPSENKCTKNVDSGNAKDIIVSDSSCKINKLDAAAVETHSKRIDDDLCQEIERGNVKSKKKRKEKENCEGKIDSPSIRKRILKLPESARKSFSSKLKLPNSLSLSSRNKLSISQLEQKNNLFIRDGQPQQQPFESQQQKQEENCLENGKINKIEEGSKMAKNTNLIISARKNNPNAVVMEYNQNAEGSSNSSKINKKSLIPSFLSSTKAHNNNSNHIKIPSTSKAHSHSIAEKLTKTSNKFREFYSQKDANAKKPPPYRPPPVPQTNKQANNDKKIRLSTNADQNYEEIDENCSNNENISSTINTQAIIHAESGEQSNDTEINGVLVRAEYPSNMFKNIPVRPRKGQISHMENYCLFDPSVDFCNEKDLMKITKKKIPIDMKSNKTDSSPRHANVFGDVDVNEEKIEDVIFEDQTLYDITEHDERNSDEKSLAHHNYYEIDPELLEKEDEVNVKSLAEELEESKIKESNRKAKIYSNTLSSSSESTTSTSNSASNSSSTNTSSSDYPSLFNSVIETTHSSTIESTDDNDSNGYGKVKCTATADSNESIITIQNVVVTCGDSNDTSQAIQSGNSTTSSNGSTGATKKKSPQLNRIIRSSSRGNSSNSNNSNNISAKQQNQNTKTTKSISTKKSQIDPMKQSHSLPHLQNVIVPNKCRQPVNNENKNEFNFVIDNTTTIQMRRSHNSRQVRPLSTHSDDRDSGFLSPATPPDCQNMQNNVIVRHDGQIEQGRTKTESTLLNQCDNIQQMIEIYTQWANYYLERAKSKRKVVDLSTDCRDGLLLAEVIEAVTNFKVPDLIRKPKTQQQMYDNVEACLAVLRQNQVGGLETITTNDICSGRLKAVLSLFFSLSRYKQASKLKTPTKAPNQLTHQVQIHHQSVQSLNSSQGDMTKERQLPVPHKINGNATSIPVPGTVLVTRRSADKTRGIPVPNGQQSMIRYPSGTPSSENSRPSSPPDVKGSEKLRFQQNSKLPPSPYNVTHETALSTNANDSHSSNVQQSNGAPKQSMLDKLKLFNKDKERSKSSKRTSSSSGFSSARSDSSLSLNNDPNATSSAKNKKTDALSKTASSSSSSTVSTQKSSKLLASTKGSKDTPGLPSSIKMQSRNDNKREKSLGRNVSDENVSRLHKVPTVKFVPQIQQMNQNDLKVKQPQQQQQQVLRKIEIRTDMKTSQLMQQHQPKAIIQPTTVTTSIPKPMAAIKGTSKTIQNEIKRDDGTYDGMKMDKQHINNSCMSLNSDHQKMQVVNPLSMGPLHNQLLMHAKCNGSSQSMSDSIHSTSTNNHSNSSESSVIYRPSASESGGSEFYHSNMPTMQQHRNPIPNRKVDHFNDPLLTVATTNGHKFNTIPTKLNATTIGIGNNHMATTLYENGKQQGSSVVPLRSIMRNYNGNNNNNHHVTLPTRGTRGGQNLVNGYYDEHNQGYCSDGDALRKNQIRYTDIENGYLSEGGGGGNGCNGNNGVTNPHFMSIFRNRPHLPMTITEERCRTSKDENLESPEMNVNSVHWNQRDKSSIVMKNTNNPKSRVKSVPQNFGYTKKSNGSATATEISTNALTTRTAAVSAVPRSNKLAKVSGGTQTTNNDFQQKAIQYKSYSLTGPGAAQLSQSVKDRFASGTNSLPKSGLEMHVFHARMAANRASTKINDGSLSDTYSDIKDYSSYSLWLRHSNTSSRLSDGGESIDSSMSMLARNQRLIQHRNSTQSPGLKLNRSNSISYLQGMRTYPRSTKSEKTYPSMLSRAIIPTVSNEIETEPYYCLPVNGNIPWSQPTSPTPRNLTGLISPTHTNSHRIVYHNKKNDEVHGSQISLMSGGSSMYGSTTEEQRQANEVRRLKRELIEAREQVMSLSSQLSTNNK